MEGGKRAMTKKELSQLAALNREVAMYDEQIEALQTQLHAEHISDTVHGSAPTWPFVLHTISLNGISDSAHARRLQSATKYCDRPSGPRAGKVHGGYNRLMAEIAKVPDSLARQVLTYRYINGLSWPQVAAHIGGEMTPDGARMMANRIFDKNS